MATSGRVRIVTGVSAGAPWVLNETPNPGPTTGYYGVKGNGLVQTPTITVVAVQELQLFDMSNNYLESVDVTNLPEGFQLTSIEQWVDGQPCGSGAGGVYASIPLGAAGGASITSWTTDFGITSASPVFVPATMAFAWLAGVWTFSGIMSVPAVAPGAILALLGSADFNTFGPIYNIQPRFDDPLTPLLVFTGSYTADDTLCPVIGSVIDLSIDDPVTGGFSWDLPPGAGGVAITLSQTGHDDITATVLSPTLNYVPSGVYGDVTATVRPITTYPICHGPSSTLALSITTPFDFTMGQDGVTTGIFLGGTPTLQFIGNPSGIYTIVPGKAYDTLYERIPAVTSQDVKIPDPYIVTAYIGE